MTQRAASHPLVLNVAGWSSHMGGGGHIRPRRPCWIPPALPGAAAPWFPTLTVHTATLPFLSRATPCRLVLATAGSFRPTRGTRPRTMHASASWAAPSCSETTRMAPACEQGQAGDRGTAGWSPHDAWRVMPLQLSDGQQRYQGHTWRDPLCLQRCCCGVHASAAANQQDALHCRRLRWLQAGCHLQPSMRCGAHCVSSANDSHTRLHEGE